jgi:hypothetical protein
VLPAIVRALPGYLLTVLVLALMLIVAALCMALARRVPYLGWLLAAAVSLYAMMFQGRVIGLIYRSKQDKLGWE